MDPVSLHDVVVTPTWALLKVREEDLTITRTRPDAHHLRTCLLVPSSGSNFFSVCSQPVNYRGRCL